MEREDFIGMNLDENLEDDKFSKIVEIYEQLKDKMSLEEFIDQFNETKEANKEFDFYDDLGFADLILTNNDDTKNEYHDEVSGTIQKIADVEPGQSEFDVVARIMSISNSRAFISGKGREGKLCNMQVADNTEEIRVVLWTQNIKHVKYLKEGDIVLISDVECREGYQGGKEFQLNPRSNISRLSADSDYYPDDIDAYPVYEEELTPIGNIRPNEKVNFIGRLIRFPPSHKYDNNGRTGRVVSLEIQDESGKISYTIWNPVPDDLNIEQGDVVKVLNEEARERNGELSVSSFNGRIVKAEADIPEFEDKPLKIQEAIDEEQKDVTLFGLVSKSPEPNEFVRSDNSKGFVRSIELTDDTGSIRVTLWGNDAKKDIPKDSFVKISGGNIELDDFSPSGYRVNTGFNTEIKVNPEGFEDLEVLIKHTVQNSKKTFPKIVEILGSSGTVNIFGIVSKSPNVNEFTRRDGTQGHVRSIEVSDDTESIRVTLWNDDALMDIPRGTYIKIIDGTLQEDEYSPNEYRVNTGRDCEIEINPEGFEDLKSAIDEKIKGDEEEFYKIDNLQEIKNGVNLLGIVTKAPEANEFTRRDGKPGFVRSIELTDDTASIRVTLWGDDARMEISRGDLLKIMGGNVEEDEYSPSGLRVNTSRDCEIEINPEANMKYADFLKEKIDVSKTKIVKIDTALEGELSNVNLLGVVTKSPRVNEFERRDGKPGYVRSIDLTDDTGSIRVTLWGDDAKAEINTRDILKILDGSLEEDEYSPKGFRVNTGRDAEIEINPDDLDESYVQSLKDLADSLVKPVYKIEDIFGEEEDVTLLGIVTKVADPMEFDRQDGKKGLLKSITIADGTGSIRVTLWGDDAKMEIEKGDIIKIKGVNIRSDDYSDIGYGANTNFASEYELNPEDIDEELLETFKSIESRLGAIDIADIDEFVDDGIEVDILARLISLDNIREFENDEGSKSTVVSGQFADASGNIRVSFWREKSEYPFIIGNVYKIENARTRFGLYDTSLNVGNSSRITQAGEEEAANIPSYQELENNLYELKSIDELEDGERNIKVVGRILEIDNPREFERRSDGTKGIVKNMQIGDETGIIRVSLWDDMAKIPCDVGDPVKIQNPNVRFNPNFNQMELSVGGSSSIVDPSEEESLNIPSVEELEDRLYERKDIVDIEEDDSNIRVKGTFHDIYSGKILSPKCPFCHNDIEDDEEECSYCGNTIEKPDYLVMIPGTLSDDTGDISVTFFNDLALELLEMTMDEVIERYEEDGDFGSLEGKVENIEYHTLDILADVRFNEYNEENRLSPRRIFSVEL